jgi:hypothetical protein
VIKELSGYTRDEIAEKKGIGADTFSNNSLAALRRIIIFGYDWFKLEYLSLLRATKPAR